MCKEKKNAKEIVDFVKVLNISLPKTNETKLT